MACQVFRGPYLSSGNIFGGLQYTLTPRSYLCLLHLNLCPWQSLPSPSRQPTLWTLFLIGDRSLCTWSGGFLPGCWCVVSLSSGFHPQSNGQMEHRLAVFSTFPSDILSFALLIFPGLHMHTSPWSQVPATGMLMFFAANGIQPPMFPLQGADVVVPSIQDHIRRCL